jgi:hypothetical protein
MTKHRPICVLVVAIAAASLHLLADPPKKTYFRAAAREGVSVLLLDEPGQRIYAKRGDGLVPIADLKNIHGKPWAWGKAPLGFAAWNNDLLIVNGTAVLERFSRNGSHVMRVQLPVRPTAIASTSKAVWLYSGIPSEASPRFWRSADAVRFEQVNIPIAAGGDVRERLLRLQITFAVAQSGDVYYVHSLGEPILHRWSPGGTAARIPLAYSRTKRRDKLTRYAPGVGDLTLYSAPVAEIFVDIDGRLIVTRNREDEPARAGLEVWVKRRVDVYSPSGRHLGTAKFAESVRTVLTIERGIVIAAALDGRIIRASLGGPERGKILE